MANGTAEAGPPQKSWSRQETQHHLRQFEDQYDRAKSDVRRTASLWIISGLGAIAYAWLVHPQDSPGGSGPGGSGPAGDPADAFAFVLVPLVATLANAGLYLLWHLDFKVYQRLLHAVFAFGLALEFKHPDLPPIRTALWRSNNDIGRYISRYYLIPMGVFALVTLAHFLYGAGDDLLGWWDARAATARGFYFFSLLGFVLCCIPIAHVLRQARKRTVAGAAESIGGPALAAFLDDRAAIESRLQDWCRPDDAP